MPRRDKESYVRDSTWATLPAVLLGLAAMYLLVFQEPLTGYFILTCGLFSAWLCDFTTLSDGLLPDLTAVASGIVVLSLSDRLAVMSPGRIVEQGTTDAVFASPAHPYTANLLKAVPMLGRGRVALTQIPGTVPNMSNPPPGCAFHPRCPSATPVCSQSQPALTSDREGHAVACHHPIGATALVAARAGAPAA